MLGTTCGLLGRPIGLPVDGRHLGCAAYGLLRGRTAAVALARAALCAPAAGVFAGNLVSSSPAFGFSGRRRRESVTGGARADRVGAKLPSERSRGRSWRGRKPEVAPGSETAWPALHREAQGLPASTVQGGNSRLGTRGGRSIRGCAGEPWWLQKSTRSPALRKQRRGTCRWKAPRADRVALLDGGMARSVLTVWACRLGRDRGRQRAGLRALCAAENAGAAQRRSGAALLLRASCAMERREPA
jgi:hypothetical protein